MSKRYEMGPKYDESTLVGALKQRGMDFSSVGCWPEFVRTTCLSPTLTKYSFVRNLQRDNVWLNPLT